MVFVETFVDSFVFSESMEEKHDLFVSALKLGDADLAALNDLADHLFGEKKVVHATSLLNALLLCNDFDVDFARSAEDIKKVQLDLLAVRNDLMKLREELRKQKDVLDVEVKVFALIKSLSAPATVAVLALGPAALAAAPAVIRLFGGTADDFLERLGKKSSDTEVSVNFPETQRPEVKIEELSWANNVVDLIGLVPELNVNKLLGKLLRVMYVNEKRKFDNKVILSVLSVALEHALAQRDELQEVLRSRSVLGQLNSASDSITSTVLSMPGAVLSVPGNALARVRDMFAKPSDATNSGDKTQ